jgi:hypothetical protein
MPLDQPSTPTPTTAADQDILAIATSPKQLRYAKFSTPVRASTSAIPSSSHSPPSSPVPFGDDPVHLVPFRHRVGGHTPIYHVASLPWIVKPAHPAEHAFYDAVSASLAGFVPGYGGVLRRWASLSHELDDELDAEGDEVKAPEADSPPPPHHPPHDDDAMFEMDADADAARPASPTVDVNFLAERMVTSISLIEPSSSPPPERRSSTPPPLLRHTSTTHSSSSSSLHQLQDEDQLNTAAFMMDTPTKDQHRSHTHSAESTQRRRRTMPAPRPTHRLSTSCPTPMLPVKPAQYYLLLEDLTHGMRSPCVLDLKMGTRQHGIGVKGEKRARMLQRVRDSTSGAFGVRLCGMQVLFISTYLYFSGLSSGEEGV